MRSLPRLSSRIRVALYGDENGVADAEKLEADRIVSSAAWTGSPPSLKEDDGPPDFTWRNWSRRFSGGVKGKEKKPPARRAFDAFSAVVRLHLIREAAAANAAGDAYAALAGDSRANKARARGELEGAFGYVKDRDWREVVDAFEALAAFDVAAASPEQSDELLAEEWMDPDYVETSAASPDYVDAPTAFQGAAESPHGATAEWLVAKCDALEKELSTVDVSIGVVTAARNNAGDDASFQAALFELLGVAGIELMADIVERQAAVTQINPADIRAIAGHAATPAPPPRPRQQQRTAGSVSFATASESKSRRQAKKRRQKEQARHGASATTSEATAVLLGLGFDTTSIEQSNNSYDVAEKKPSHARALLEGQAREFHGARSGLPENATRTYGDGYEEVVVEPPKALAPPEPGQLVTLDRLPAWARHCFPASTVSLNRVQSAVFETVFRSQKNTLVCAPTGAGKTYVALLCVLEVVARYAGAASLLTAEDPSTWDVRTVAEYLSAHKVVYIAPLKALAQEVVQKFSARLKPLGLVVRELTGDIQLSKREADAAHVLVATPEKWDVVTRKQGTEGSLAARCRLLVVDEIHLLAEERGAVLECVVARTRRLVESSQSGVRLVGLSATLPNYADVADFLACPDEAVFFFGSEFRPVPLKQTFVGITEQKRLKAAAKLDELAFDYARRAVQDGHQVMIFVHSRRETSKTATYLRDRAGREGCGDVFSADAPDALKPFKQALDKARHKELRDLAPLGFAVHHAGMCRADRGLVEQMFSRGAVKVLCCTATLAWGVNLPAHAVICKGTDVYSSETGTMVPISMLDVMQIFGRAGRPDFDDFGEATLLTSQKDLQDYLRKLARAAPIESCLVPRLADAINAEVAAGTVSSIRDAVSWLSHTFLAVRLRKNPMAYGISLDFLRADPTLAAQRRDFCEAAAAKLVDAKMVRYSKRSGAVVGTDVGRIGSHYYLRHETVREFGTNLSENATYAEILVAICSAHEFAQLQPRADEIPELDRLRANAAACPLQNRPAHLLALSPSGDPLAAVADEPAGKAACLLQAHVSRADIGSFTLSSDAAYVAKNASRVTRALFEVAIRARFASLAERLLQLAKAVERRVWWFQTPLRQVADLEPTAAARHRNFPEDALKKLEDKHVSLDRLLVDCSSGADVGVLVGHQRAGGVFVAAARHIPNVELSVRVVPITRTVLRFVVTVEPDYDWVARVHGLGPEPFWIWVEDATENRLHHYESINLVPPKKASGDQKAATRRRVEGATAAFTLALKEPIPPQYFVRAYSDRWLGSNAIFEVSMNSIALPETRAEHTDLLPLHPLPKSALGNATFESLFSFSHFNPIQTQLFYCLYHTDNNVFLGAPTGSGKTIVAEIAIMRMLAARGAANETAAAAARTKAVYIAPLKALARERLKDWRRKFGEKLGLSVLELTGDATPDARALREADVLVTTPEKWDGVTRFWKRREYARQAALLIIDEIHLLGEDRGPVIEAIVSRARFVATNRSRQQQQKRDDEVVLEPIRIVGLSTAVSNAHDLADWLGVNPKMGLYNFRPAVRPVTIDAHVAGFPGKHYCPRMSTMNKPTYAALVEHASGKPSLVFVASRRQTRLTALELISIAGSDDAVEGGAASLWVEASATFEVEAAARRCEDAALRDTLPFGVGLHHAGLPQRDRDVVEELFESGKIKVLICTATLAWGVNFPARLVVIKGTEYYDAAQRKYVDFPITDVLQMMGRAGRPQHDDRGVACVFVHQPKKDFYLKFLYEPFPVESHLRDNLHNNLMAEVCATRSIESRERAVEYVRCTYFYRRLLQNPTYYQLDDAANATAYLGDLVEATLDDLAAAGAIELDDLEVRPATLGRIASFYYVDYKTTRDASDALDHVEDTVLAEASLPEAAEIAAVELLCAAREFDDLPVRHNEDVLNENLAAALGLRDDSLAFDDAHVKARLLVHARLRDAPLPIADFITDTRSVLEQAARVLAALIDVAADAGALRTTLALCRLSQALGRACSIGRDELCQLPGISDRAAKDLRARLGLARDEGLSAAAALPRGKLRAAIDDALEQGGEEDTKVRGECLRLVETLPSRSELSASLADAKSGTPLQQTKRIDCDSDCGLRVTLTLKRQRVAHAGPPPPPPPRTGNGAARRGREEPGKLQLLRGWWIVLADGDELLALKRVAMRALKIETTLSFPAPEQPGPVALVVYAVADDCRGFDATTQIDLDAVASDVNA
ncbi:hypothetical protein CTAYLR_005750 [Chrysophaeum taylorii]|uniref:U5 small nuclear ribonucleoprotein 200 kDa helicase n=1 Tax=Chrysophaeum taylorii TaxID=2483200 RepID=A0AAD7XL56_9STRA|nr:hypothetical protein CTAYLR_005750 [Chrysophaeum taylorii]